MPTESRHEGWVRLTASLRAEQASPELPLADPLQTTQSESIATTFVELAERREWERFDQLVTQLAESPATRGAVLMRALNITPLGRGQKVLPFLIFHDAPLHLVQKVIALGALHYGDLRVQEHASAKPVTISYLHLAALKNRFDIVQLLLREGHSVTVLNSLGESVPEQFARVARRGDLHSEHLILQLGSFVRRLLGEEGIGPLHFVRLIDYLCQRQAWNAAETVIDECTLGPPRPPEVRLPRGPLSDVAWTAALRDAPTSLFASLRALDRSEQLTGNWTFPSGVHPAFLMEAVPPPQHVSQLPSTWKRFEARLRAIELAAEFTHPGFVAALINATGRDRLLLDRLTDELVVLGIEDPPMLQGDWTVTHALVGAISPVQLMERFLRLGPDLSVNALVYDNGRIVCDGTPLHYACAMHVTEYVRMLIRAGAPLDAINSGGEIPLHSFFNAYGGRLQADRAAIVAEFLRAGSPIESRSASGADLGGHLIGDIPFRRLMQLVDEYAQLVAEGIVSPQQPASPGRYVIDDGLSLVEVDEIQIRAMVVLRLRRFLPTPSAFQLAQMPLEELLKIDAARNIIETLYAGRYPGSAPAAAPPPGPAASESDSHDDTLVDEEDEDDDSEWLQFPDFGSNSFDNYQEFEEAEHADEPEPTDGIAEDELDDFEEPPLPPPPAEPTPPQSFDDVVTEALDDDHDSPEDPSLSDTAELPFGGIDVMEGFIGGLYGTFADESSYYEAAVQFLEEGSPHESYLLLEALKETTAYRPTRLNATTRALRTLLFRTPPGVAQHLGLLLDQSGYHQPDGMHPYMAEYLCLLNHPFDRRKDVYTIGGLSLGISSVARLVQFGSLRGDVLHEYGRIGALNFSFPFWRFDTQPIRLDDQPTTLFELAGMGRPENAPNTYWENPTTGRHEHFWGPAFTVAPGDPFHDEFDQEEARQLGYAPLSRHTVIVWRRAGIFIGTDEGVLLVRNSSLVFGRDRFDHPGLVCPTPLSVREIINLTPEDVSRRFASITGCDYFSRLLGRGRRLSGSDVMARAAAHLKHFNDQFQTVRARYARLKFDTHLESAWSRDGSRLFGGYRSPLFRAVVDTLEDRWNRRPEGGKGAIEFLGVANPDYPPYAPHATLAINEHSLEVLRLLAEGKESQVSARRLRESGVEQFLKVAFSRGRNSELILMPGRESTS